MVDHSWALTTRGRGRSRRGIAARCLDGLHLRLGLRLGLHPLDLLAPIPVAIAIPFRPIPIWPIKSLAAIAIEIAIALTISTILAIIPLVAITPITTIEALLVGAIPAAVTITIPVTIPATLIAIPIAAVSVAIMVLALAAVVMMLTRPAIVKARLVIAPRLRPVERRLRTIARKTAELITILVAELIATGGIEALRTRTRNAGALHVPATLRHLLFAIGHYDAVIMLGMLQIVFSKHRVATRLRISRQCDVLFRDMRRGAPDFHVRAGTLEAPRERVLTFAVLIVIVVIIVVAAAASAVLLSLPHGLRSQSFSLLGKMKNPTLRRGSSRFRRPPIRQRTQAVLSALFRPPCPQET